MNILKTKYCHVDLLLELLKPLMLIVLVVLVSAVGANFVFAEDNFSTYKNSEFGYKIDYPSDWSAVETGDSVIHVVITSPFENNEDEYTELALTGAEKLFADLKLDAYTEMTIQSLQTPSFKIIKSEKITLSGNPAQKIEFSDKNDFDQDFTGMAVWTIHDKYGYFIMFAAEPSKYSEYQSIFEDMLNSFEVDSQLKEPKKFDIVFEDYSTHIDSVNEMKFQYPTEWNKLDLDEGGIHTIITSPLENYDDEFSENIVIGTEEIPFGILNLKAYNKVAIQNLQSVPEFEIIEENDTTLAGLPGHKVLFSQKEPTYNIEIKSLMVWTMKDNVVYFLGFGAEPEKYTSYLPIFEKIISSFEIGKFESMPEHSIPDWIRNNAGWWAQGAIGDSDFVSGIQYLIKEGIMTIPETSKSEASSDANEIPSWIKNNADWWAQGLISDDDFVKGIQFLIEKGIMEV